LIPYLLSTIVPALKVKVGIHRWGIIYDKYCLSSGLAVKTLSNPLKGRNKYPWEHTSKTKMNQNKEGIGGS